MSREELEILDISYHTSTSPRVPSTRKSSYRDRCRLELERWASPYTWHDCYLPRGNCGVPVQAVLSELYAPGREKPVDKQAYSSMAQSQAHVAKLCNPSRLGALTRRGLPEEGISTMDG